MPHASAVAVVRFLLEGLIVQPSVGFFPANPDHLAHDLSVVLTEGVMSPVVGAGGDVEYGHSGFVIHE